MIINFEKEIQTYLEEKDNNSIVTELIDNSEITKLLDEIDRKSEEINRLKLDIRIDNDRENKIIKSLIEILDSIEWFSSIAMPLSNDALRISVNNTKRKIRNSILTIGLTQINEVDSIFNCNLHNCIDIKEDYTKDDETVDEIVRSGYIYKGKVIRTADVIVIKNK